ncbi:MAG: PhzF family phenazine biosynthesis protein, partial [Actinomycetota bacterium]|nr:PhzF family phenazine biosynthesis protein [Actinomycetota bacterium]
ELSPFGVYCFTAVAAGRVRARALIPSTGIPEDAATGSAAACLGVYLADRVGPIEVQIDQGIEMGRPSHLKVWATATDVRVAGRCALLLSGKLESLP